MKKIADLRTIYRQGLQRKSFLGGFMRLIRKSETEILYVLKLGYLKDSNGAAYSVDTGIS